MENRNWVWPLCMTIFLMSVPLKAAQLPSRHEYQKTLRNYLASLTEEDYAIRVDVFADLDGDAFLQPDAPLGLDEEFKAWLLLKSDQAEAASCVNIQPKYFLLKAIESESGILTPLPRARIIAPAWLAAWDNPCNRYYDSVPLKRRAFLGAAVDLIMLDNMHQHCCPVIDLINSHIPMGYR